MRFLIFILLTLTCSAQKAEYDVINDFLASELKNVKYDTIYLQIEPLDNVEMLWLYEQAYKERSPARTDPESVWLSQQTEEWPLDEKGIIYLHKRIKAKENNWKAGDFANKSFVLKEKDVVNDMKFRLSHLNDRIKEYVLRLSKPLFSKNKKYALFKFSFTELIMGGSSLPNLGTVVMKKENDKWIVLNSIREAVYN